MNTKTNSPTPAHFWKWAAQYRAEGNPTAQAVAQQASEVIATKDARIAELEEHVRLTLAGSDWIGSEHWAKAARALLAKKEG